MVTMDLEAETRNSTAWDARSDCLYHFYAYHFFDQVPTAASIELVNLDDADIQFYNRTADMTRGLDTSHKLAEYLATPQAYKIHRTVNLSRAPSPSQTLELDRNIANTYRRRFIHHIRTYNMTQEPRRRFYMLGLNAEDVVFLESLEEGGKKQGATKPIWVTDGCFADLDVSVAEASIDGSERLVEQAVERCLAERQRIRDVQGLRGEEKKKVKTSALTLD